MATNMGNRQFIDSVIREIIQPGEQNFEQKLINIS